MHPEPGPAGGPAHRTTAHEDPAYPVAHPERDASTTPRWLRAPALLLCAVLAGYFSVAYTYALEKDLPAWLRAHPWSLWLGTWQMFTYIDPASTVVYAEARVDGEWQDIDLEALFPYRWESGPRYARTSFRKSRAKLQALGAATCGRLEAQQGITAERIRFRSERIAKTKGKNPQPKRKHKVEKLLEWTCGPQAHRPPGEVW